MISFLDTSVLERKGIPIYPTSLVFYLGKQFMGQSENLTTEQAFTRAESLAAILCLERISDEIEVWKHAYGKQLFSTGLKKAACHNPQEPYYEEHAPI
jgi:hypothetical protein